MAKQRILPFFIPMEGCPYRCIYCDQVAISGHDASPKAEDIREALACWQKDSHSELAFYGGSFTCLPRERQLYYLDAAAEAVAEGSIGGIRISTRPDAIDEEICRFLREHGVITVELGVQSFDDRVLRLTRRGYDGERAKAACRAVVKSGLRLGVQLMTGLPGDEPRLDTDSVRDAAKLGAELLRIYPTLVLENTPLAQMYKAGEYAPQKLDEAVDTAAAMCALANAFGMTLIRVGLNPSPDVEAALVAGPYHPAFGGLVKEQLKQKQLAELLGNIKKDTVAALFFPRSELPLIFGHQRRAMQKLALRYPSLALIPDDGLPAGELKLQAGGNTFANSLEAYCRREAGLE